MGVIDGGNSRDLEDGQGIDWQRELLRKIDYKL
jgi:adenosine/AMP kinase